MPILHRLATIHNAADDRAMAIGRLCYSIGGLKIHIASAYLLNPRRNFQHPIATPGISCFHHVFGLCEYDVHQAVASKTQYFLT